MGQDIMRVAPTRTIWLVWGRNSFIKEREFVPQKRRMLDRSNKRCPLHQGTEDSHLDQNGGRRNGKSLQLQNIFWVFS